MLQGCQDARSPVAWSPFVRAGPGNALDSALLLEGAACHRRLVTRLDMSESAPRTRFSDISLRLTQWSHVYLNAR